MSKRMICKSCEEVFESEVKESFGYCDECRAVIKERIERAALVIVEKDLAELCKKPNPDLKETFRQAFTISEEFVLMFEEWWEKEQNTPVGS